MKHIAETLKINSTLSDLYLCYNEITSAGAGYLAESLKYNNSL
jgi:hypothetical protein